MIPLPRRLLVLLLSLLLLLPGGSAYGQFPFADSVRRVVFLGNSITYDGRYIAFVETYLRARYPNRLLDIINLGLPSETVSGLSEAGHAEGRFPRPDLYERLGRVLAGTKPDLVIACYGMNDGIYLPFDEGRFEKFRTGIDWLHETVRQSGAHIIHLTPPVYDELKGGKTGYAAVLDRYSDWLLNQKTARNWSVIDLHYPMKQYLDAHRKVDAAFALAEDGIHPGDVGHWLMAKSILLGLGETVIVPAPDLKTAVAPVQPATRFLKLVTERQHLLRDAWLTATGHQRPGLKAGLPVDAATAKGAEMDEQFQKLLHP